MRKKERQRAGWGHSGMGCQQEARPGLEGPGTGDASIVRLPRRVRGMSDGPRHRRPRSPGRPCRLPSWSGCAPRGGGKNPTRRRARNGPADPPSAPAAPGPRSPAGPLRPEPADWMARKRGTKGAARRRSARTGPQGGCAGDPSGTARPAMDSQSTSDRHGWPEPGQSRDAALPRASGHRRRQRGPAGARGPGAPPELLVGSRVRHRRDPAQARARGAVSTTGEHG